MLLKKLLFTYQSFKSWPQHITTNPTLKDSMSRNRDYSRQGSDQKQEVPSRAIAQSLSLCCKSYTAVFNVCATCNPCFPAIQIFLLLCLASTGREHPENARHRFLGLFLLLRRLFDPLAAEADVRRAALADQLAAERASRETERRQRYGPGGSDSSRPRLAENFRSGEHSWPSSSIVGTESPARPLLTFRDNQRQLNASLKPCLANKIAVGSFKIRSAEA